MNSVEAQNFKKINTIIERDAKDTTYKFALLRAVIEISQEYYHLRSENKNRVVFPLGLLIDKWLIYFYPLLESQDFIPQKHGETRNSKRKIAFRRLFNKIIEYYSNKGGFSVFYNDYRNGSIPPDISSDFWNLIKSLKRTITTMPMRYLGRSVSSNEYSIFTYERGKKIPAFPQKSINQGFIVKTLGTFSFPIELYEVFQYLGSFISGEDSLIYKWAEFSHQAQNKLDFEPILKQLRTFPITEKETYDARVAYEKMFTQNKYLECVWSGKPITKLKDIHIDHMIPFSIWKNNDLWNLLPSHQSINLKKRDRIPSLKLIDRRKEMILHYWGELHKLHTARFKREITLSLLGKELGYTREGQDLAIDRLKERCYHLISNRGLEEWSI
jgi:hypothetical protein